MPPDLAKQYNPLACKADLTYSMTAATVKIQDTGKGKKSVGEDLEAVLLKIEYWHQGSIVRHRLVASAHPARNPEYSNSKFEKCG